MFNIYTADLQGLEDRADKYIKDINNLDEEAHDIFLEKSAYSPFEYKWKMARQESYVWEITGKLHHLNEVAIKHTGYELSDYVISYLVDNEPNSENYNKCIVCGEEINGGNHGIKRHPLHDEQPPF